MTAANTAATTTGLDPSITLAVSSVETFGDPSQAVIGRNGTVDLVGGIELSDHDWITPKHATIGDLYQMFATVVSGTGSGTTGSWIALSSNRTYANTALGSFVLDISIRRGTGATLSTRRFTITHSTI